MPVFLDCANGLYDPMRPKASYITIHAIKCAHISRAWFFSIESRGQYE